MARVYKHRIEGDLPQNKSRTRAKFSKLRTRSMNLYFFVPLALAWSVIQANTICPGAPSSSYGNGLLGCTRPVCLASGGGLRPSADPTKFFVCAGLNIDYEMSCAPGTCFSYEYQVCVHPRDWTDDCLRAQGPTTTTTQKHTTTTTTTQEPTTTTTQEPSTSTTTTTQELSTTVAPPEVLSNEPARSVQICPSSDPNTISYGAEDCDPFQCSADLKASYRKFPSKNPLYFYYCFTDDVLSQERCPTGTCFDYGRQQCVLPSEWQNYCSGL